MAVINGATTPQQVYAAWRASIWSILRLTWVISTLSMATAQKFLAPELCAFPLLSPNRDFAAEFRS